VLDLAFVGRTRINVSTRKLRRAVRLPKGDLPIMAGGWHLEIGDLARFVALSAERLAKWHR
jgi:hypothetical protein